MRNNIELFINNRKVDLSESTKILFTYRQKDVYSPVAVKNSFSKTITLEGTKTNNDIFNNLYSLDVSYSDGSVNNFNSSKRNPFELYNNGELIESGYMKLDSIKHTGNLVKYNVTLYGGLGDFLYNLMYDADGNKKTLASLDFGTDLSFNINKESVQTAWNVLNPAYTWARSTDFEAIKKWQYINFMPCYNGITDTIDTEHILVNTNGYSGKMRKWDGDTNRWVEIEGGFPTQLENNEYLTRNGYGLVTLPKPMNEWQTRDLRSYLQRPAVNFKKVLEAICNKKNNGGYEVVLDSDFFKKRNPYYENAWISLPLLKDINEKVNQTELTLDNTIETTPIDNIFNVKWEFKIDTEQIIPGGSNTAVLKCRLGLEQVGSNITADTLYLSAKINNNSSTYNSNFDYGKQYQGICLQVLGYDAVSTIYGVGQKVAGSNLIYLTSEISNGDYLTADEANVTNQYGNVETKIGYFVRSGNTNTWVWPQELTFKVDMDNVDIDHFRLCVQYRAAKDKVILSKKEPIYLYNSRNFTCNNTTLPNRRGKFYLFGNGSINDRLFDRELKIYSGGDNFGIFSDAYIDQKMLLSTENTPADYLLSYTKLFNLYYDKDPFEKKIYIRTMKNFYDGKMIDLDKKIDRSKEINITPLAFDTNVYEMEYKTGSTSDNEEKYLERYGSDFGSQRINTGYDFDSNKKELYDGVYTNGVQSLQSSKFYTMSQSDENNETPTFLYNTVTYQLFNSSNETSEINIIRPNTVTEAPLNAKSGSDSGMITAPIYDAFDKVQFSNNEEPIDGKDCFVFFNGFVEPYVSDYQPYYLLSDDVQTMISFCDKPCYLYSQSEYDINSNRICYRLTSLPHFSRYITVDARNLITQSWDIGATKEIYTPDFKYANNDVTIYNNYWKNYFEDLYDIDNRIVECYVRFDEKVMQANLKHYYYFDNSYWIISEIIDYNPDSSDTVKVKFVKVNNFGVYTQYNGSEIPEVMSLTLTPTIVGSGASVVDAYVWVEDGGEWFIESDSRISFSQTSGVGDTHLTFTIPANTGRTATERTFTVYLTKSDYSYQTSAKVTQLCRTSDSVFAVEQFGDYINSDVPQTGGSCSYTVRSTFPWTVTSDRSYCVPQASGGTGNTQGETLIVDWSVSDTYGSRNAWLTFSNTAEQEIRIYKAQEGITSDQYLEHIYPQTGGNYTINNLISGGTVATSPYWVETIDNEDGTYSLIAEENPDSERNGTVVLLLRTNEGNVTVNVQVTQYDTTSAPSLTITPNPVNNVPSSGGTISVTLNYTKRMGNTVSATTSDTGITVGAIEFSGSTAITTITVPENKLLTTKSYSIVFSNEYVSDTLVINQNASEPYLNVTPSSITFSDTGGTATIIIDSNDSWTIN